MRLESKDIVIRMAENSDAPILYRWWSDGAVMAHAGFPNGLDTSVERIRQQIENTNDQNRLLMIDYRSQPIGEMNFREVDEETVAIGIKICQEDQQNRGLGRVVLSMLIKELFKTGYKKIVLDTNLKNTRAQHVYETLGFKKINIRYHSWKDQLGEFQSAVDYELVEKDFIDYA